MRYLDGWFIPTPPGYTFIFRLPVGGIFAMVLQIVKRMGGCRSLPQAALQRQLEDGRNEYYIF